MKERNNEIHIYRKLPRSDKDFFTAIKICFSFSFFICKMILKQVFKDFHKTICHPSILTFLHLSYINNGIWWKRFGQKKWKFLIFSNKKVSPIKLSIPAYYSTKLLTLLILSMLFSIFVNFISKSLDLD